MTKTHKLGVIVPYRNRWHQLFDFKEAIRDFLNMKKLDYELIVVEQDDAKEFNRGKLLNVGFIYAKKLKCDYVVFHDLDMLPIDVDYTYSDIPLHLATNFEPESLSRHVFEEYFGGVTLFPVETFEKINGYSNEYWGWGFEDDDLLYRCRYHMIKLEQKTRKILGGNTASLKFDGKSYVETKNALNMNNPSTIFVSFYPDEIECDKTKYDDTYCILSIPKHDLSISYNSYKRYGFVTYNGERQPIHLNSEIKPNYKTNIAITINPELKVITMFQDGDFMGETTYTGKIFNSKNDFMYIGARDPGTDHFSGLVQTVAIFDGVLLDREIRELSYNQYFGFTSNFGKYNSSDSLILYYDPKFIRNGELINLGNKKNNGNIVGCDVVGYTFDDEEKYWIPYRREGKFKLLSHEENGYVDGSWKNVTTRYNQIKFYNDVSRGLYDTTLDG